MHHANVIRHSIMRGTREISSRRYLSRGHLSVLHTSETRISQRTGVFPSEHVGVQCESGTGTPRGAEAFMLTNKPILRQIVEDCIASYSLSMLSRSIVPSSFDRRTFSLFSYRSMRNVDPRDSRNGCVIDSHRLVQIGKMQYIHLSAFTYSYISLRMER